FVTHAKQEAFAFADQTAILNQGRLVQVDSSQKVYEQPKDSFVAKFMESGNLLACQPLSATLFAKPLPQEHAHGFYLLHENGFALHASQGEKALVKDCLYVGYRYRLEVEMNGQSLFVEAPERLAVGSELTLQYQHQPTWVADSP
ncbi:MAG: hypothetical protein RPR98_07895, partial [Bermanella sp.]